MWIRMARVLLHMRDSQFKAHFDGQLQAVWKLLLAKAVGFCLMPLGQYP